jgi:hypothetical protein
MIKRAFICNCGGCRRAIGDVTAEPKTSTHVES